MYTSKFWPMNWQMTFYGTTLNRFALLQLKINLSRTCSNCPHCLKIRTHFLIIPSGQGRMHACLSVSIPVVQSQTHLISRWFSISVLAVFSLLCLELSCLITVSVTSSAPIGLLVCPHRVQIRQFAVS